MAYIRDRCRPPADAGRARSGRPAAGRRSASSHCRPKRSASTRSGRRTSSCGDPRTAHRADSGKASRWPARWLRSTSRTKVGTWVLSALHRNPASSPRWPRRSTRSAAGASSSGWVRATNGPGRPGVRVAGGPHLRAIRGSAPDHRPAPAGGHADFEGTCTRPAIFRSSQSGRAQTRSRSSSAATVHGASARAVRHADIWSCYIEERAHIDESAPRLASLDAICGELDRDPATLGRSVGVVVRPLDAGAWRADGSPVQPRKSPTRSARSATGIHASRDHAPPGDARGARRAGAGAGADPRRLTHLE